MQQSSTDNVTPWYRQFWPWFLIAIPLITIGYCIFFITMSMGGRDSLVTDSFYKDGLVYKERQALQEKAAALGLVAHVAFADDGGVKVTLDSNEPLQVSQLVMQLIHPTLESKDQKIVLHRVADGSFQSSLQHALSGRWHLFLKPMQDDWRLTAHLLLPSKKTIQVAPESDS
ncbi:FixH family protein [Marinobacteraceae bacterium S3BR75-40.1]